MQSNDLEKSNPVNQWTDLNRLLFIYKLIGAVFASFCLLLVVLCFVLSSRKPIVALASGDDYFYLKTTNASATLSEGNIRRFVESYVRGFYEWKTLEPERVTQQISPLVTDGFKEKAFASLTDKKTKVFVGKDIRQEVAGLTINVTKENTTAVFDAILRIDGVPIVIPTQVLFQLVKGNVTDWNPLGLYINGITVHEGK